MLTLIEEARFWFRAAEKEVLCKHLVEPTINFPPYGGLVYFVEGKFLLVEIDYTDPRDQSKLQGEPVGIGWRDRFTGLWQVKLLRLSGNKAEGSGEDFSLAVEAARLKRDQLMAEFDLYEDDPLEKLDYLLETYNWWYRSDGDDYQAHLLKLEDRTKIDILVKILSNEEVRELWGKRAPKEFACPV